MVVPRHRQCRPERLRPAWGDESGRWPRPCGWDGLSGCSAGRWASRLPSGRFSAPGERLPSPGLPCSYFCCRCGVCSLFPDYIAFLSLERGRHIHSPAAPAVSGLLMIGRQRKGPSAPVLDPPPTAGHSEEKEGEKSEQGKWMLDRWTIKRPSLEQFN